METEVRSNPISRIFLFDFKFTDFLFLHRIFKKINKYFAVDKLLNKLTLSEPAKMATGGDLDHLTRKQIVRLAAAISADNMASIAEGYMDIDDATIKNKKFENKDNAEAFNRDIIKHWMYKNPDNQVQVR